jgi:membrane protein YdbS with pleckstrin-like domain
MGYLSYELNDDERLVALIRKHWATLAWPLSKMIIAIAVIVLLSDKISGFRYGAELILVWIIASIFYGVYEIIVWYLDCFIITDKRIIDIDQKGMLNRIVAEVAIDNIQETVYEISGPLETVFNYGTVKIKAAGSGSIMGIEQVPNPESVKDLIVKLQN